MVSRARARRGIALALRVRLRAGISGGSRDALPEEARHGLACWISLTSPPTSTEPRLPSGATARRGPRRSAQGYRRCGLALDPATGRSRRSEPVLPILGRSSGFRPRHSWKTRNSPAELGGSLPEPKKSPSDTVSSLAWMMKSVIDLVDLAPDIEHVDTGQQRQFGDADTRWIPWEPDSRSRPGPHATGR